MWAGSSIESSAGHIGQARQLRGSIEPPGPGPESNQKLLEKFKKQFEDNLPLASFGL